MNLFSLQNVSSEFCKDRQKVSALPLDEAIDKALNVVSIFGFIVGLEHNDRSKDTQFYITSNGIIELLNESKHALSWTFVAPAYSFIYDKKISVTTEKNTFIKQNKIKNNKQNR